jgi:hypothetical protein
MKRLSLCSTSLSAKLLLVASTALFNYVSGIVLLDYVPAGPALFWAINY